MNEECTQIFESKIDENASEVDGKYILAKVVGEGFTPDGVSRNKRFYPRRLWEKVCSDPELRQKMNERRLCGTVGHSVPMDDESFRKGEFSHIIKDMYIDPAGKGIVEALIVNTPAGRVLNTFLRAGTKMFVSTRASGDVIPGKLHEGCPIVDPDNYMLEGVDFVLEPGFLNASPNLVESLMKENTPEDLKKLEEAIHNSNKPEPASLNSTLLNEMLDNSGPTPTNLHKDDRKMDNLNENKVNESLDELRSLNESLVHKNAEMKLSLNEAMQRNNDLLAENKELKEQQNILNEEVSEFRALHRKLSIYESLGEPEEIQTVFDMVPDLKDKLSAAEAAMSDMESEFGSAEEIRSALEKAEEIADELDTITSELGSAEEIEDALCSAQEFVSAKEAEEEEFGSAEEIREALATSKKIISAYRKLGTPRELQECLKVLNETYKTNKDIKVRTHAKAIAEKYGISETLSYDLVKKGIKEADIATLCESKNKKDVASKVSKTVDTMFNRSLRGASLMESFSK